MEGKGSTAEGLNAVSCYRTKVRPPPPASIVKFLTISALEGSGC